MKWKKNYSEMCSILCGYFCKGNQQRLSTAAIDSLTNHKIKTDLLPVLTKRDSFDLETAKKVVKDYLNELLVLTPSEKEFLDHFEKKVYIPQLLFEDPEI